MRKLVFLLLLLLGNAPVHAQAPSLYPGLVPTKSARVPTYYTPGYGQRARYLGELCSQAIDYLRAPEQLGFTPRVRLLVLGPADWKKYARIPAYGMPHTVDDSTLVVAAEDNLLWQGMVPPAERLTTTQATAVRQVYHTMQGRPSMMPFYDLLALHELGHAFFRQARLGRPRYWLDELFANLMLHTFVAERQPGLLPTLEVFPQLVVDGTDARSLTYTSLADFERQYGRMENVEPRNYGWYQCRLHRAAARIYSRQGATALPALWRAFRQNPATYDDAQLAAFLQTRVGPELALVQTSW